jgi:hypothetical protein
VRKQAPVVVDNILHMMGKTAVGGEYDGYASCPLTTKRAPGAGLAHLLRKEDCKGHEADDWADLRPLTPPMRLQASRRLSPSGGLCPTPIGLYGRITLAAC